MKLKKKYNPILTANNREIGILCKILETFILLNATPANHHSGNFWKYHLFLRETVIKTQLVVISEIHSSIHHCCCLKASESCNDNNNNNNAIAATNAEMQPLCFDFRL